MAKTVHTPEPGNELPAINESEVPVVIKLPIPAELYVEYEALAKLQGLTVSELMIHRLRRCKDHNSLRALYFTDSQRAQLENILQKRPLETAEQAISLMGTATAIDVGGFNIRFTPQQIRRINMGAYAGQTASERLEQIIKGAVAKAYGV